MNEDPRFEPQQTIDYEFDADADDCDHDWWMVYWGELGQTDSGDSIDGTVWKCKLCGEETTELE